MNKSNITSLAEIRTSLADAEPLRAIRRDSEPPPGVEHGGWRGEYADPFGLPLGCPVIPLGISSSVGWFLDPIGQVQELAPPYGKGHLLGLFAGNANYLTWAWPRFGKGGTVDGYAAEQAAADLIGACAYKGPWDSIDKVRGRGCWVDGGGNLVVHVGTSVIVAKRGEAPGEIDGFVYPTRARIPGPVSFKEDIPWNPAQVLRPILRSWTWQRPDVDPMLLLGWIGAAYLGAALPWRPMVFLTGDKGTGKSTLQALIKGLFGEWLIQSADTTAAGLYQHIGLDSIPIAVDELESEADVRKQKAVLKLARLASSGAAMLRGGDRHKGVEFNARSAFLFSSINAPPLEPQDLSRMALLRLDKLTPGQPAPKFDPRTMGIIGRCILRRLIEEWPRFEETFEAFAGELGAAGMDGRGQAQFGTLLTCADMLEHQGWDNERLSYACDVEGELIPWRELLQPSQMHEFEDAIENWRGCLSHLLSVRVDAWRNGGRQTVGQVVEGYYAKEDGLTDINAANSLLAQAGLKIVWRQHGGQRPVYYLAVHNQGVLVRELFAGSKWHGEMGAAVWSPALRMGERGKLWELGTVRINGVQSKATLISLDGLYGEDGVMKGGDDD